MSDQQLLLACEKSLAGFPVDYAVIDTETTGFARNDDLIWNFALLRVRAGRPEELQNLVFDWTHESVAAVVDAAWLRRKIDKQQTAMAERGRRSKLTLNALKSGLPPLDGMHKMLQLLDDARLADLTFVGHGIINFDIPRIAFQLEEWLGVRWRFGRHKVIDTAALEKSLVAQIAPGVTESFFDFSRRVLAAKKAGVKWNLDDHCVHKYDLLSRAKLASDECHDAGADCRLCHELLTVYRGQLEVLV